MTDTVSSLREQLLKLKARHEAGKIDDKAYAQAKAGLERRLVDAVTAGDTAPVASPLAGPVAAAPRPGRGLWAVAAAVSFVVALGGYLWTGSPGAVVAPAAAVAQGGGGGAAPHALDTAQIAAITDKLAARLKDKPDDADGWSMLGRSYMVLDKPAEAASAYERAVRLRPDDAAILVDYADALAMKNGRDLAGEPTKLIERALKLEPDNLKALMLAGTVAFNQSDYAGAVRHWERMAQVGPADHPMVQQAAAGVAEARRRGLLPGAATPPGDAAPAAAGAAVSGTVALAPALASQVAPDDAVFIFARAAEGSRMPLALLRKQVKDLPLEFRLDDSLAISPDAKLSGAGRVIVGARVSKSGQAMPQPGDLEGLSAPAALGASGLRVEISAATK